MTTKARFIISAAKPSDFPPPTLPELAVVGRSNVGKSSLINMLVGQDGLARTSRTPGRTRLINWFEVGDKKPFFLVDLPGYGYADVAAKVRDTWRPLIENYLETRTTLAGVLLLVDIRRGVQDEELDFVPWLEQKQKPLVVALTKADKLSKSKRLPEVARARKELGLRRDPIAVSTIEDATENLHALWKSIFSVVDPKPPKPTSET